MSEQKKCGGGVMLVVPKILNPKLRKDLNHTNFINFESMWIERNISSDLTIKKSNSSISATIPLKTFWIPS